MFDDISLSTTDILRWMTGSNREPVGGFPKAKIKVTFEKDVNRYPQVSTCDMSLILPLRKELLDPELAVPFLVMCINGSEAFGSA